MEKNYLIQTQAQAQVQTLTPQQLLVAQLMELPVEALRERVETEMLDNPSLERDADHDLQDNDFATGDFMSESSSEGSQAEDRLADYTPDDVPDYLLRQVSGKEEGETRVWGETASFHDLLKEQMGFYNLNDHQRQLLEYLIGSLGDDGLLTTPLEHLADELEVYHNVPASPAELEEMLHVLQQFEPAGVGARNLKECLLLQVRRGGATLSPERQRLATLIERHFDLLMLKRWDRIQQRMHLTDAQLAQLQHDIRHLNPRPGSSLDETVGQNVHQITPDFIVETTPDGEISLSLNQGDVPPLRVSSEDMAFVTAYSAKASNSLSRSERDGLTYMRSKVERAQAFIDAMQQRRENMLQTMQTIIQLQRPWFESGDETLLRPMRLEDVAQRTGLALSTISRVSNSKWVQTPYGIYPLRWFFTSKANLDGDAVSVRNIQTALRELIDAEDPQQPLPDDTLTRLLNERGYKVARRTVAKYREQMKIPVARLRKS